MAIVRQNQYNAAFATTVNPSVTWTNATLASDVLVVFITHNNAASSSSITPPAGGGGEPTWTALTGINLLGNTAQSTWIQPYWSTGTAVSAGHVSTFTLGTNTRDSVTWGIQYSGVQTVSPVDQQAGNFSNTANTAWDSGTSATTTNANDVLLSLVSLGNDGAGENIGAFGTEVPVGWSTVFGPLRSSAGTATQGLTCYGFEFIVSSTSAPHLAATMGVSALWSGCQLSLKATATASLVSTPFDELTAEPLLTGPWGAGPILFQEVRDELIFIAPPSSTTISPPVATASASAPVPTITISLPAPVATAAASSLVPVPQIGIPAPVATAAASAPVPAPQVRVLPAAATASASSPVPTLQAGIVVPVATASANSPPPVPQIVILAPAATASASAPVPTIITGTIVSPPAATASASAPAPTITISLAPPAATASASAPVPTPQVRLSPPAATAAASSPAPTPQLRVSPAAATAAASALVPVPQVRLLPPAATASGSALVPTVTVVTPSGAAATVAMFGYVTGLPASGTVTAIGDGGLVLVGSSGTLGQTGASGLVGSAYAPIHICPLGVTDQALGGVVIADAETLIGRQFHGLRQNADISTNWVNTGQHIAQFDTGRTASYRACQNDPATQTYAAAIAGTYDANFTTMVNNIVNSHRWTTTNPFIVCYGHEVTVSSWDPLGTKQQFIDAYRHFRLLLDSLGASVTSVTGAAVGGPIIMAYVGWDRMFTNGTVNVPTAGKAYTDYDPDQGSSPAPPGTTYYTLVGSDVYNNIVSGSLQYGTNAATLLDDIVLQARNRNKDWMIGEIACADGATTQSHQDKAAWWDSVRVYLDGLGTTSPGVCRYMFTTIKADSNNYNVDSSAESLAAWRRLGFDVYYA